MSVRLPGVFLLHERAREHFYSGPGPYSIKWFPRGSARYRVNRGTFVVDASSFLVLNDGDEYTVEVEDEAESLCVFFDRETIGCAAEWITRTHRAEGAVMRELLRLRTLRDREAMMETTLDLASALMALHDDERRQIDAIDAARPSTKRELYRRAHLARDFIAASLSGPVPLAAIAGVAAMSPNHLLRTFRRVFGRSPHQYLTELRLERARTMLARGASVTEACFACGFESLGSFSALFRRRFGVSARETRSADRGRHVE